MSTVATYTPDLRAMREYALEKHSHQVEAFFGEIPPMLVTQEEIESYLAGRKTNSVSLVFNGRRVQYDADPYTTWYAYPFFYVAFGEYFDDYRSYTTVALSLMKSASCMHLSSTFYRHITRDYQKPASSLPPPSLDVLVDWHAGVATATLGTADKVHVIEASGHQWRVGHGTGDVQVVLPKVVEHAITPDVIPRWTERDFTDPNFYHDDAFAYVQRSHVPMAKEIVLALPKKTYLIVPGDGSGLFADLWDGPGVFGDPIVTKNSNPRVVRETAEQTIARAAPGNLNPVVICSFVSVFFNCDTLGYPSIWIDNPKVMDRVPGLVPVTEALYTRGIDLFVPVILDRPFRAKAPPYHVPYLKNLLKLKTFRISILSRAASVALRSSQCNVGGSPEFSDYVFNSGSVFCEVEAPWLCPNVESMFYPDASSRGDCYLVPLGNVQNVSDAQDWDGHSPLFCRFLYSVREEELYLVPQSCYVERAYGRIYLAVRDDVTQVRRNLRVGTSFSSGIVRAVIRPERKPVEAAQAMDYDPVDSLDDQFPPFVSPHDLQDFHVELLLRERPLGSNQLREAIKSRWPSLVFTREHLLRILKGNSKYRIGPNFWSVNVRVDSSSY